MTDAEFIRAKAKFTGRGNKLTGLSVTERLQHWADVRADAAARHAKAVASTEGQKSALEAGNAEYQNLRAAVTGVHGQVRGDEDARRGQILDKLRRRGDGRRGL